MSAWRRVAIEKIPRYRMLIEHSESIGMLWVDLWCRFVRAHSDPIDEELIGQIYDYASWCAASPDPDTRTAGVLSFYTTNAPFLRGPTRFSLAACFLLVAALPRCEVSTPVTTPVPAGSIALIHKGAAWFR